MRKTESQKIALCGVLSALSVVLLLVGNVLQIGTYAAPMLASFLLIPVLEDYGKKYALLLYAVVSLLSLFLVPDKELVLFYVLVLGYYPVLRVRLNNIRRGVLRWVAKFGCFNAAVVVMYALLIVVLAPPELVQEFAAEGTPMLLALLALGIRGIRLGPTLPAFLSPGVAAVLQEKYDLKPTTTPEADLAACLGE